MSAAHAPRAATRDGRSIFLVGFMGVGKTTLGRLLAERLGWPFHDTDDEVVRREGREIESIFATEGEGFFRRVEWEALQDLGGTRPLVVATGGGLFLGALQRRWLKRHGTTVWVDLALEACRARVGALSSRPLWHPEDPLSFRAFFEKRRACYALADLRLDAADADPAALAGRLMEQLRAPRVGPARRENLIFPRNQ